MPQLTGRGPLARMRSFINIAMFSDAGVQCCLSQEKSAHATGSGAGAAGIPTVLESARGEARGSGRRRSGGGGPLAFSLRRDDRALGNALRVQVSKHLI